MSHRFDATVKDMLADPQDFVSVFGLPNTSPAQALNVDLSTISAATDVAIGFGDPLQEIVDLNFQSGPDATLPARLLLYNAAYYLRYNVPVASVVILLRQKADAPNLSGSLAYVVSHKRVEFAYEVVRMWQQPVEPFLQGGLGLLPFAPLCRMRPGQTLASALREVVHEIDRRLSAAADHARAVRLMTAAFILTGLRVEKETLVSIYEGVRVMHESTAYDTWVEEGTKAERIRLLLRLGTQRFKSPDGQTEHSLKAIDDLERLERMTDAILTVDSWRDLLSIH